MTRRILAILFTIFCVASSTMAANYYVDGDTSCTAGNGTSTTCGASGPKRTIAEGIALLSLSGGDTLNVRGAHGSFNGVYRDLGGFIDLRNKKYLSTTTIQPYLYTTIGAQTEERVYIQGDDSSVTWVQCTDCSAGSAQTACRNIPGTCGHSYYVVGAENYTNPRFAVKADGSPTYQIASPSSCNGVGTAANGGNTVIVPCCTGVGTGCGQADMSNAHTGYITARCTLETWLPCYKDENCFRSGDTCNLSAAAGEIDSYADGTNLVVRWGAGGVPAGVGVVNSHGSWGDGNGWTLSSSSQGNQSNAPSNIVIRGFIHRDFTKPPFVTFYGAHDSSFIDNKAYFVCYNNGSDYAVALYGSQSTIATNLTVSWNQFGFVCSEIIHTAAQASDTATNFDITNNYFWGGNDLNLMGNFVPTTGTAQGIIMANDYDPLSTGNYGGSTVDGNVFDLRGTNDSTQSWVAVRLENQCSNVEVKNNIMLDLSGAGIFFAVESGPVSNNSAFNNIIYRAGRNAIPGQGYLRNAIVYGAHADSAVNCNNNKVFNNTIINPNLYCIALETGTNNPTSSLIRNNICYADTGSNKMVDWPSTEASNVFENNDTINTAVAGSATVVTWKGANYTCTSGNVIGNLSATDKCSDPSFVNSGLLDFHILTSSPAKDAGVATGMPSGKTQSINNPLASRLRLPQYNGIPQVGSAWDMGATEYRKRRYFNISEFRWKRPEPWRITNAAYLRKIEKED